MLKKNKTVCIFGGTGFIGRQVIQNLAQAGYKIKVVTRFPESTYALKTSGIIGQIVPFKCRYSDAKEIQNAIKGCDIVVNLVGILYQKNKNGFMRVHNDIPKIIATACKKESVKNFIHVSALGVDQSSSKYAQSKLAGEKTSQKAFPNTVILRPSVVFGAGDSFFNMFAKLACFLPALPLIGGGKTKFQPVYVGDIAQAVRNVIETEGDEHCGQIYELGGPEVVTFKEIYQRLLKETKRSRRLISISWPLAKIQGFFLGLMPDPLLTLDQVQSLKTDNVVQSGALTLENLGVTPTAMGSILPEYLACYRRGGPFGDKKTA